MKQSKHDVDDDDTYNDVESLRKDFINHAAKQHFFNERHKHHNRQSH